jgi:hypothetical protein
VAKSTIPDPLTRRHLIEKDLGSAAMDIAEAYLEVGRKVEAIEFLVKAKADERLRALLDEAVASGDVFMIQSLVRATGEDVGRETWQRAGEAAEAGGFERYAVTAFRQARREED